MAGLTRRRFLQGAAAGLGLAAVGPSASRAANLALPQGLLPSVKPRTPVEHTVVLMMENRSVDHYLGWYGAENAAFDAFSNQIWPGPDGAPVATRRWAPDYRGCGFEDPGHGWRPARRQYESGFMAEGANDDEYAVGYYTDKDIPVWAELVREFTTFDRYFCSLLGPTQPNRYYLHSAQSNGFKDNSLPPELAAQNPQWALGWDWPTIWTLLDRAGVTWAYYYCNLPEVLFWGPRHLHGARHISSYYADAAAGRLPQVAFVDPWFIGPEGIANDDHPHADIRLGQEFLADVAGAFVDSPNFERGALFITYDEWGGFFDHVKPPRVIDDRMSDDFDNDFGQLGFRVPTVVVSPWTRGAGVDHTLLEHTSILRFIEDNYALPRLTKRDANTNSIASAFGDFSSHDPDFAVTDYTAPLDARQGCGPGGLPSIPVAAASTPVSDLHRLVETGFADKLNVRLDWKFEDSFR